ncbi:type II toxin-antitoxin system RelE/ParE family toxin (plasmid) [Komagataeibacter nataicola]|uniref:RelE/StbE family addiction module toxin n=1 Tax=Acetobacter tropicalis TaxID=104102 RepID=A0A252A796_9PROT|nr:MULTISPECIES: type II toxin-antitoxin system RelE/ParE family toxin [Acetobacteraceae]MBE7619866.1 type II toxin-antitoxin system mRNA interferase toxin, RelE/StbE family [Komagataeibacter sp. FXV2]MCG4261168.1 type II toxin-antitoxin system RelE/ParE family toxin [Acetobacter senegalensis]OUI85459.1 RelE/StbE family addiction module toxin [Acetobacter tropicalis]WEQ57653.1 type II toxin-antitoxin system RelE/ParE family toxin [Komagataeibacter nataicola]GCE81642.1 translation repressor Rel
MTEYAIEFDDRALREWDELDGSIRRKFEKKLEKLILNPYSPGNELHGDLAGFYKIKLRQDGYRLVYQIVEQRIVIFIIAVGRREDNEIYMAATGRVPETPADRTKPSSGKRRIR